MKNYAVIFTYSFDSEIAVYLFETFEEAKEFLKTNFELEKKIDIEENGWEDISDFEISEDGGYAKIINHFPDRDDITEYHIGNIYQ